MSNPWKCAKCGEVYQGKGLGACANCYGKLLPYDRRRAAPEAGDRYREALRKILGWREYHDHFERTQPDVVRWIEEVASNALSESPVEVKHE